jgi:hypothetical protein
MTSKEQAKQIADALLSAAEAERVAAVEQSTRPLVRTYPALKHVPALERHAALREAREFAAAHATSRLFLALISIAIAAVAALGFLGLVSWAIATGIVVVGLLISRQFAELSVMRKYLASRYDIPNPSEDHR